MDVTPLIRRDAKIIQSYRGGTFKISNEIYTTPVFIMPDRVLVWEFLAKELTVTAFEALRPYLENIEVLLLGTGNRLVLPSPKLRQAVKAELGFTLETMDTGAACRTYNVLLAEGRKIAAGLQLFN